MWGRRKGGWQACARGSAAHVGLVIDAVAQRGSKVAQRALDAIGHGLLARVLDRLASVLLVHHRTEAHVIVKRAVLEHDADATRIACGPALRVGVLLLKLLADVHDPRGPPVEAKDRLRLFDNPPRLDVGNLLSAATLTLRNLLPRQLALEQLLDALRVVEGARVHEQAVA